MNTPFPIPLFSAQTVNAGIDALIPIQRVLNSHWYILGNEVTAFEQEFAAYCGVSHCISLANGTDALELGLRAVGVKIGDQVMLTANAGFYSSTAIHAIGAIPYYVDIESTTLTLSVDQLQAAFYLQPKAIIVTHLYGQLAAIENIIELAKPDVVIHGFVKDIAPLMDSMRLSVAPLRYGAGVKGKVGTALAAGLPTVATPIAVEGMSIENGEQLLIADNVESFVDAIARVYFQEDLWAKLSRSGIEFAENSWGANASFKALNNIVKHLGIHTSQSKYPLSLYDAKIHTIYHA